MRQLQSKYMVQQKDASGLADDFAPSDICPCCYYPIDRELFPLCVKTTQLNELGAGFPLYFDMVTWLTGLMVILLAIAGVFCLRDNYKAERISEYDDGMSENLLMSGTLGTH